MIASLSGKLLENNNTNVVIDCRGVGYLAFTSIKTAQNLGAVGSDVFLQIELIAKEDSLSLYGFSTKEEKEVFKLLIAISGIGPKIALSILSSVSADELRNLVLSENVFMIQKFPGIGKKTAERLILELKDKFSKLDLGGTHSDLVSNSSQINEAIQAMISLGYSKQIAEKSIQSVMKEIKNSDIKTDILIVKALNFVK